MTTPAFRAAQFLGFHTPSFRHRLWPSLVVLLIWGWLGGVAFAQSPQIVVNGVGAPGPVTATGGMALTVTVTNGPAGPTDWVGFYQAGRPDNEWIDWKYLSDSQTAPTVGMTSGTVLFLTPPAGGAYEVRFFSAGSFTRLAVGPGITAAAGQTTNIASGSAHTLVVLPDRTVMSWGSGAQIGDGTPSNQNVRKAAAVKVRIAEKLITDVVDPPALTDVAAVAATATSSAAIKSDGTLWTWGQNTYGLLGDGNSATRGWAKSIALSGVVALAGGANHLLALKSDGSVYAWGSNGYGQIGNGAISGTWVTTPVAVTALGNTVIAIGAAGNTSYAIKANGTLWVWGSNQYGEVGNGTTSAYVTTPTQATTGGVAMAGVTGGSDRTYAWTATGALYAWGYNGSGQLGIGNTVQKLTPTLVPSLTNVTKVVAGLSHALALRSDNTLWSWGFNANGQLGDGTNTQRLAPQQVTMPTGVSAIAASDNYSVAVGTDGRVTVWGGNFSGQLGDSTTWDRWSPQQIINPGFVIRTLRPNFSISGGTHLSTGTLRVYINAWTPSSTVRYTTDGTTPTTGSPSLVPGGFLDLPQNTTLQAMATSPGAPASLVENATYALKVQAPGATPGGGTFTSQTNIGLTSTTANAAIRYTLDGSTPTSGSTAYTSAIPLTTGTTVKAIATRVNWLDSDVLTSTYTFNYGTLATPTAAPAGGAFQGSVTVTLSGPVNATIRYTTNGTDPTTASTAYSAPLVFGTTTTLKAKAFRTDYTPSATLTQTYTITTAAPVLSRNSGAYDPGTRVTITTGDPGATLRMTLSGVDPTSTDPVVASGSSLLVGAYTLKVRAFKSGAIDSAVTAGIYTLTGALVGGDAAAGGSHTLLATPSGLVYGWGDNGYGQLGDSSTTSRSTPRLIQTLTGVSRLAAGVTHSVGTTMDGQVYTWGGNGYGQLGDGTTNSRSAPYLVSLPSPVTAVAAGYYHTLALTATGRVYVWGWGTSGQLGLGTSANVSTPTLIASLTNVVAIAAGQFHSLAITASGQVYAWGWNANGQLGDGTTAQRLTPTLLTSLTGVTSVAAGGTYSLARTSTGAVYAWGYGPNGELGLGAATTSRTSPMQIAGLTVQAITAGAGHSAALRTDGSIATWGTNSAGQLGDGTTTARTAPVSATGLATMAVVSVGSAHTVAVRNDGAVFTWGTGTSGRLGDGGTANRATPFNIFAGGGAWGTPAPVLSLPPGIYRTTQTLGVSAPLGATVRYTTNGQPPTETDTVLAAGSALPLTANVTLAFRAWSPGLAPSAVTLAEYQFQPLPPTATPAAGTYLTAQSVSVSAAAGTTVRYTLDGTVPTEASPEYISPIAVEAPATLTAKAFRGGWTPSASLIVGYSFALTTPQPSPSGGILAAGHPVTLSAASGASIHYTLDGTPPNATSPIYATPLTLVGDTTLKAYAVLAGWVDSAVLTASYSISPHITSVVPPSGPPGAVVTLTGAGFGSSQGSSVIAVGGVAAVPSSWATNTIDVQVPTTALSGDVTITVLGRQSNAVPFVVTTDSAGPVISTHLTPLPKVGGWHRTAVTATFECTDPSGVASCPAAVTVESEGASLPISASASDTLGNQSTISIAVSIDRTAPVLTITQPENLFATEATTIPILASFVDVLSGVPEATCNGDPAVIVGNSISCSVSLVPGANTITVRAMDAAGNSGSASVRVSRTVPRTSLTTTPEMRSMLAGEESDLTVLDQAGVAVNDATWLSDNPSVATIVYHEGAAYVQAVTVGQAVVSATVDGLTASMSVNVFSGNSLPVGASQWSVTTPAAMSALPAYQVGYGDPEHFVLHWDPLTQRNTLAAIDGSGRVVWREPLAGEITFADPFGGVVTSSYDIDSNLILRRIGGTNGAAWEYKTGGPVVHPSNAVLNEDGIVQAPDGTIYHLEFSASPVLPDTPIYVVAVDGRSGVVRGRVQLPMAREDEFGRKASHGPELTPTSLFVAGDGNAYVGMTSSRTVATGQAPNWVFTTETSRSVVSVTSLGTSEIIPLMSKTQTVTCNYFGCDGLVSRPVATELFADVAGGIVFRGHDITEYLPSSVAEVEPWEYGYRSGIVEARTPLDTDGRLVRVSADDSLLSVNSNGNVLTSSSNSGSQRWSASLNPGERVLTSVEGNGTLVYDPSTGQLTRLDAQGARVELDTLPRLVGAYRTAVNLLAGLEFGENASSTLTKVVIRPWDDRTVAPSEYGSRSALHLQPQTGIFATSYSVVDATTHVGIHIIPTHQRKWLLQREGDFRKNTFNHKYFATIAAESSVQGCGGLLVSTINRPKDVEARTIPKQVHNEALAVSEAAEDEKIELLFSRNDQYPDDLPYGCFPDFPFPDSVYNSNSFAHGLLNAAQIPVPAFPTRLDLSMYPGWVKPVPLSKFGVVGQRRTGASQK